MNLGKLQDGEHEKRKKRVDMGKRR